MSDSEPHPYRRAADKSPLRYLIEHEQYEATIVANLMQIDSIKEDLEEFKSDTKTRMGRIESWVVSSLGVAVTTLLTMVVTILGTIFLK